MRKWDADSGIPDLYKPIAEHWKGRQMKQWDTKGAIPRLLSCDIPLICDIVEAYCYHICTISAGEAYRSSKEHVYFQLQRRVGGQRVGDYGHFLILLLSRYSLQL